MSRVDERVMLVTGAAGAIGSSVVDSARQAGYRTIGVDMSAGPETVACDITDEAAVMALFAGAGPITDVVHTAGIAVIGTVRDTTADVVDQVLRVNLLGSFIVARAAVAVLPRGGTLTLLASQAASHGSPGWSAYCASKAGVVRLVQSLAKEVGPDGIRVNAISPGTVESPMIDRLAEQLASARSVPVGDVLAGYRSDNPLGRLAQPQDIADACLFLASEAAGYITGATIAVDGGDRPG